MGSAKIQNMKFLHLSDIHLGCQQYQEAERMKDFFRAWYDVLSKYAIGEKVDFVLMCGDFFHKRNVEPQAMNHAVAGLQILREHNIPVVAIEGNHDQANNAVSQFSWLRSLANWGLLVLLEPEEGKNEEGKLVFNFRPWDDVDKAGSYIDIGKARIFGSNWAGSSASTKMPFLVDGIAQLHDPKKFNILMLHTDIEGHEIARHHHIPALTQAALRELKSVTNYVALGHTHKRIEIENWAFNPGSLESCTIDEYKEERGAFLVQVGRKNEVKSRFIREYRQRPFQRLSFDVSGLDAGEQVTKGVLELIEREAKKEDIQPVIEVRLRGHLGFPGSLLEITKIRDSIKKMTNALQVRLQNHTVPLEYAVAPDANAETSRLELEKKVIEDLVFRDNRFQMRSKEIAEMIIGAKRQALSDEPPEKILEYIAVKLN
jgi:DNA repair exonuclease SbcCD nuclease subunit